MFIISFCRMTGLFFFFKPKFYVRFLLRIHAKTLLQLAKQTGNVIGYLKANSLTDANNIIDRP